MSFSSYQKNYPQQN